MEGELGNFIKVWITVFISLCYCYIVGKSIAKGPLRLLFLLPIVCLFLYLPLELSSMHLGGLTGFFITWLGNFKLLLFAFGKGPLASDLSNLSLIRFVAVASLPIKIFINDQNKETPSPKTPEKGQTSLLNYAIKGVLFALLLRVYDYSEFIHPKVMLGLYGLHIYFSLELTLAIVAAMAKSLTGDGELEPQFNEPYLCSSLQDFWGRRWNLMVTSILRQTVYEPTRNFSKHIIGRKWAPIPAVIATFSVSALMHEIIFYYLSRLRPTWKITWFFLLHGFCLNVEIVLKKTIGKKWRLPRLISGALTIVVLMITSIWLLIPQLLRFQADVRTLEEIAAFGAFIRNVTRF
ncbi:acyl-CoA--sterol O-acyltransferase 1-like [Morus notabilis]|uniref:acyl-CoA--sterol O-acyltransferase 1-like n=1 Tax=Morus notabilis TaxID=981085 RepID=UPI000CED2273|nr:acyl-CoA--sterol O-acyltransferase 1-like [Morus notabilis]